MIRADDRLRNSFQIGFVKQASKKSPFRLLVYLNISYIALYACL